MVAGAGIAWWLIPTPKPEIRKGTAFNCRTIGKCAEDCARRCPAGLKKFPCMIECASRCNAKGCESGRKLNKELTDCVQSRCLLKCIGGPGPKCQGCSRTKCRTLSEACVKHRCE